MQSFKKILPILVASILLMFATSVASATTKQEIQKNEKKLQQTVENLEQKESEKQTIVKELKSVQKDLESLNQDLAKNKEKIKKSEQKIKKIKKEIDKKKEEIVVLEEKVFARKSLVEKRAVSLQMNQENTILEILFSSDSFSDLIQRAAAITTFIEADRNLLEEQKQDLTQIEAEKNEIAKQEEQVEKQYEALADDQALLEENLQMRKASIKSIREKYQAIKKDITLAKNDKTSIQEQIKKGQELLKKEQQEVKKRNTTLQQQYDEIKDSSIQNGKELYVVATAYSHDEPASSDYTASGYNIAKNPDMKLIAVDPSVIPLGSKVWVEGYGQAIAGDTGGAIKGHKIDVLLPSMKEVKLWGRKVVKVVILE